MKKKVEAVTEREQKESEEYGPDLRRELGTSQGIGIEKKKSGDEAVTEKGSVVVKGKNGMQNETRIGREREVVPAQGTEGIRIRESLKKANALRGESDHALVKTKRKEEASRGTTTRRKKTEGIRIGIVSTEEKRIGIKTRTKILTSVVLKLKRSLLMIMGHTIIWTISAVT